MACNLFIIHFVSKQSDFLLIKVMESEEENRSMQLPSCAGYDFTWAIIPHPLAVGRKCTLTSSNWTFEPLEKLLSFTRFANTS